MKKVTSHRTSNKSIVPQPDPIGSFGSIFHFRLESIAKKIKLAMPWIGNPFLLIALSLVLAHVVDTLMAVFITSAVQWVTTFDTPPVSGDIAGGFLMLGMTMIIYFISFPFWFWVCVKKLFKLFSGEI